MEHNDDTQQLLEDILSRAENGEFTEFQFLMSWGEFVVCNRWYRATKLIIKILKDSSKKLFKVYCKDVIAGISDVSKIVAYTQMNDVIEFYKKELDTLSRMLDEYEDYLWQGNFWYAFLGGERF